MSDIPNCVWCHCTWTNGHSCYGTHIMDRVTALEARNTRPSGEVTDAMALTGEAVIERHGRNPAMGEYWLATKVFNAMQEASTKGGV